MALNIGIDSMSADDRRWQAESDARTLAEAEEINSDEARIKAAAEAAKAMAEEKQKEAHDMQTVAKRSLKFDKM